MDYLRCFYCKNKFKHHNNISYFFYCSEECKITETNERKEKRKKEKLTHNPPARRGEVDYTNEIIKQAAYAKEIDETILNGKPKGKRKCGKCGEVGHNARTCKKG